MTLEQGLRYGENPHQPAAFYTDKSLAEHNQVCAGLGGVCWVVFGGEVYTVSLAME